MSANIDRRAGSTADSAVTPHLPLPDTPYRGITPFRFVDQQIFAARAEETWSLLSNLTLYRAALLYGDSGTGKSSIINAGLLPRVIEEGFVPDRLRVQPIAGSELKVERIQESDGPPPTYLPSNFSFANATRSSDGTTSDGDSFEISLSAFRQCLEKFRVTTDVQPKTNEFFRKPAAGPLLIFDQFEEYITLFEEAQRHDEATGEVRRSQQAGEVQRSILDTLVELIQDETLPIKIIFVFREDYLAKLSLLFERCPELLDQALRLLPPTLAELPGIIRAPFVKPALRKHFLEQSTSGSEIMPKLAARIVADLSQRSESDLINLTELQIICKRLWESHNPDALYAQSGVEGLVEDYGEEVFSAFPEELHAPAIALLGRMLTASNTRNIVSEDDLIDRTSDQLDRKQLAQALDKLASSQIVRREVRRNIYFYEITSEYLVPLIKKEVAKREVQEKQREAEKKFVDEQRRVHKFRFLFVAVLVLTFIFIGVSAFAFRQWQRALKAEQETEQVLTALRMAMSQNKDESLKGIAQIDKLIQGNKIPSELKSVLITKATMSQDKQVAQAAVDVLVNASQMDQNLAQQLPLRFFIHIADEKQRPLAEEMATKLRQNGYIVPSIQNAGSRAPKENELRYFRKDESRAQKVVEQLRDETGVYWVGIYNPGYENSPKVTAGYFEIWYATAGGGRLRIKGFVEDGKQLSDLHYIVTIRRLSGEIIQNKRSQYFLLAQGDYLISAEADGYEQFRSQFSIQDGQDTWIELKFFKRKVGRPERVRQN
jgi:hypothetical protein